MRPWIIVLSSAVFATLTAAALAEPELSGSAHSDLWSTLLPHLPTLAVAAFGIYALSTMLMTTGTLVAEALSVRRRLGQSSAYKLAAGRDWQKAFGSIGWQRLAAGLIAETGQPAGENEAVLLRGRFVAASARAEIARLHYVWLARCHFFSALIVLTALLGLGLAQEHSSVPLTVGAIPTVSAILILAGLILLAILGRIALDVSVEPLIEAISQLPTEDVEAAVLRRAVELIEGAHASAAIFESAAGPVLQPPERLETVIEEGQRKLLKAVRDLRATTGELGATMQSSVEALKTTMNASATPFPAVAGHEHDRSLPGFAELRGAVEALTAVLERLTTLPDISEEASSGERGPRSAVREPHLAHQLRQLLEEMGAAR